MRDSKEERKRAMSKRTDSLSGMEMSARKSPERIYNFLKKCSLF